MDLPRWNLDSIYPSFDSPEYRRDIQLLQERISVLKRLVEEGASSFQENLGGSLVQLIRAWEAASDTAENLDAYAQAVYTADTHNERALKEINGIETLCLPLKQAVTGLQQLLYKHGESLLPLLAAHKDYQSYQFFVQEALVKAAHQMPQAEEDLASDLARSGADAWSRLHEAITSNLSVLWDSASGETKTVSALRALAFSPDRTVRERAYKAELEAWQSVELPLAACLNGVKGWSISLDTRRGWKTVLEKSAFQNRLAPETLDALIATIEEHLPLFREYLHSKARILGLPVCTFYDLFAPLSLTSAAQKRSWTWEESTAFIVKQFSDFDLDFGAFAKQAFDSNWIDSGGRPAKVGGAYCTGFPLKGESRILCNFAGSFDSVSTVAHELGHAWHHECIRDLPRSSSLYPMTLAETASTFAETIILEGALQESDSAQRLGLIENSLKDCCQTAVDILSRFYFEQAVFERRQSSELSPSDFCALMIDAQKRTYGDGLDSNILHPYMWAVKSHYYSAAVPFYNYPYAFGQVFSLCLYAQAKEKGSTFYRDLLRGTGNASCEDIASKAGFDITSRSFWRQGMAILEQRVRHLSSVDSPAHS
ncbi:MAG: M3 family oligoendopeptidase [Spirochaetaceae bacterium]|nr:M3 family oligoendopeptidase [Spirochaetaceae bacterium]